MSIIILLQKHPEKAKNPSCYTDKAGNHVVETLVCEYSVTDESLQVKESIVKLIRLLLSMCYVIFSLLLKLLSL